MSDYLINPRNADYFSGKSRHLALEPISTLLLRIIFGLMGCAVVVVMLTVIVDNFAEIITLNQSGTMTQAKIIDHYSEMYLARRTHFIEYQFLADGRTITQTERVSRALHDRLSQEDYVTVMYLPESPDHARFSGADTDIRSDYIDPICLPLLFSTAPLIALISGWQAFRERWQQRTRYQRLEKHGRLISAKVLHVTSSQVWEGKDQVWQAKIFYCIVSRTGKTYTRRIIFSRPDQTTFPVVGDRLKVLFINGRDYEVL